MSVTLRDIAKKVNVSHTTVSRVLNNRGVQYLSDATRERVLKAAREMGYQPNRIARALSTGSSETISFWMHGEGLHQPFYSGLLGHMRRELRKHNLDMQIIEIQELPRGHDSPWQFVSWPVDGIIAVDFAANYAESFAKTNLYPKTPIVCIATSKRTFLDEVYVDRYTGARDAVQHLVSSQRKRIAFVAYGRVPEDDARYLAYNDVMDEAGLEREYVLVREKRRVMERNAARTQIQEYIRAHGCPGGLFCYNDDSLIGSFRGIRDLDLRVPDDIALVGHDGIPDLEYFDPPLSTVKFPFQDVCRIGCEYLVNRIKSPLAPQQSSLLKTSFLPRKSSIV